MRFNLVTIAGMMLLTGCATHTAAPQPAQTQTPKPVLLEQPFIERSAIFFPEKSATFTLANTHQYDNSMLGVALHYVEANAAASRIDIFVFPYGRAPATRVLDDGVRIIRNEIERVQASGLYTGVKFGSTEDATVVGSRAAQLPGNVMAPQITIPGRRFPIAFVMDSKTYSSIAYMFYRYLYFIEVRISLPTDSAIRPESIGEKLTTEVVSHIRIDNAGSCGGPIHAVEVKQLPEGQPGTADPVSVDGYTFLVLPNATKEQLEQEMLTSFFRVNEGGCSSGKIEDDKEKPRAGERVLWLKFTKGDWTHS